MKATPSWSTTSPRSTATSPPWTTFLSACKEGEIFGLLGPNGAGKSHAHPHDDHADSDHGGNARLSTDIDVPSDPDAARRSMGVIPQAMTSDIDLTVEENLNIYAKLYGVPRRTSANATSTSCWRPWI